MTTPHASIDDLLVHADFLRRLVRDLVADETAQLDLTQQVWLQALRTPPRDARGLRGWLATTARNLVANTRRSDARRAAREAEAAPREPAPAADEILAREAVRECVLRAVLALDEPFREAVLLRYYKGLEPREIAARLGVPDATVRTRVARGLERLRARLDAQHRDRGAWALAALPLARAESAPFGLAGVLAVKKVAVALALLVLALVAWRFVAGESAPASDARGEEMVATLPPSSDAPAATSVLSSVDAESDRSSAAVEVPPAPPGRRTFPARRGRGSIHGLVVDASDAPLADVVVRARPYLGGTAPGLAIEDDRTRVPEVVTDASGIFSLVNVDEGPVRVEATFPGGSTAELVIVLGVNEDAGPLRFTAKDAKPPALPLEVLVVDASGLPVADARVEAFGWSRTDRDPVHVDAHATEPAAHGTSGTDGRVVLDGPPLARGAVFARSSDERAGWSSFFEHPLQGIPRPLHVVIGPTGSLAGVITGVSDESLRGARLSLHALSTLESYHPAAGRRLDVALNGASFEARDLPAGKYAITLSAPAGACLVHPRQPWDKRELENSIAHVTAVVEPGRTSHIELAAVHGAGIRGRVTAHGAPIANARVRAVLAPLTPNFPAGFVLHGVNVWRFDGAFEQAPASPVSHRVVRTDADGRYELASLTPGRWRVEVAADGLTFDRRMDVELAEGSTVELSHELVEAGVLQVGALESSYLGVFPGEAEEPVMLAVTRNSCATFAGLAPGRYRVASVHTDESIPHVFLGEATVEAGRTTWVDLRGFVGRVRVRGTVRVDGVPLPGATVVLGATTSVTDSGGRFEFRRLRMPRFQAGLGPTIQVQHAGIEHGFVPIDEPGSEERELDLDLVGAGIEIEVVDAEGQPIAARISADWFSTATSPSSPREAIVHQSAADGRFTLALGPGKLSGEVVYADGSSARIECAVPRTEPLRIVRSATGTLTVRALRGGRPVEGQKVKLESAAGIEDGAGWERVGTTDAEGRIVLEVPAGTVMVRLLSGFPVPVVSGAASTTRVEPGGAAEILLELDE